MLSHRSCVFPVGMIFVGVVCSVLPDLDVVGFRFGVPYGHLLGHPGLSHSIAFAVFRGASLAWRLPVEAQLAQASRMMMFGFLFLVTLSHGIPGAEPGWAEPNGDNPSSSLA